jgi:predicted amidohydrolase YtcJ
MPELDLIILSENVYDMVGAARPLSIGIIGDRIVEVSGEITSDAKQIMDFGNRTILPGFNDAHCHTVWFGLTLQEIDCNRAGSLDELYSEIAKKADSVGEQEWVTASGYNQLRFDGYPDIRSLDMASKGRPVFIRHTSGHSCIVNSKAYEMAGLADVHDDASIIYDSDGAFTGLLEERAQARVQALILPKSQEDIIRSIDLATQVYAREGITSFSETGIGGGWIGHSELEFAAYQTALEQGRLHTRAQLMPVSDSLKPISGNSSDPHRFGLDLGIRTGAGNDMLSIGPVKLFMDGSLVARTAAVTQEFNGGEPGNFGYLQEDESILRAKIVDAAASGWSVAAHALGDRAVNLALEYFEEARDKFGNPRIPHRIEHGGMVTDSALKKAIALGVHIVPQPGFFPTLGKQMRESIGDRTEISHRVAVPLQFGAVVPGSSDRPVANGAPLSVIQSFVERLDEDGVIYGPDERVDAETAMACYTKGSAIVTGYESSKGTLEVGKLADLVILEQDPTSVETEQISKIEIKTTVLGGRVSYER